MHSRCGPLACILALMSLTVGGCSDHVVTPEAPPNDAGGAIRPKAVAGGTASIVVADAESGGELHEYSAALFDSSTGEVAWRRTDTDSPPAATRGTLVAWALGYEFHACLGPHRKVVRPALSSNQSELRRRSTWRQVGPKIVSVSMLDSPSGRHPTVFRGAPRQSCFRTGVRMCSLARRLVSQSLGECWCVSMHSLHRVWCTRRESLPPPGSTTHSGWNLSELFGSVSPDCRYRPRRQECS